MSIVPQAFALEALLRINKVETAIDDLIRQVKTTSADSISVEELLSILSYLSSVAKGGDL